MATFKTVTGTHRGGIHGIPATGRSVEILVSDVFRIADGKIVEGWALLDEAGLLRQLGLDIPGWA